jgi:hypothetical protein
MRSKKISISPGMLIALVAVFMIGSVSASTAGSLLSGKKIKKGSIPYSALSSDAKKKLKGNIGPQGPQGPAGAGVTKYWALISETGTVLRSSGGVTANFGNNGGTFPADVSQCGYFGSTADPDQFNQATAIQPTDVGVARSTAGNNTLAVTVTYGDTSGPNSVFFNDNFFIAAVC